MLNEPQAVICMLGVALSTLVWTVALYNSHARELDCHHAHEVIYDVRLHFFIMVIYITSYATYIWTLTVIDNHFNKRGQLRVWIRRVTLSLGFRTGLTVMWTWSFLYKRHADLFATFVIGCHLFIVLIEIAGVSFALFMDEVTRYIYHLAATTLAQVATLVVLLVLTSVHVAQCSGS